MTEAIEAARSAGLTVSYDLNYRRKLWSPEEARRVQEPMMRRVNLLFGIAYSALKHSHPGDVNLCTREEVERLIRGGGARVVR